MLARIAFFQSTTATSTSLVSTTVSSIMYTAFFLAYGANTIPNSLLISSRFHRFPWTSTNREFSAKKNQQVLRLLRFEPGKETLQSIHRSFARFGRHIHTRNVR